MKRVTAAIIEKDGRILITQRSWEDKLSLKWEFPGGKIEKAETPEECLIREIKEELNLDIQITSHFMNNNYRYETGEIELICYFVEIIGGELKLHVHETAQWIEKDRLREFDFAPADIRIVNCLCEVNGKRKWMSVSEAWQNIIKGLLNTPADLKTVPKIKREPLWFYASTDGKCVYINNAIQEKPSCNLTAPRKITYKDFETVYSYYSEWADGIVGVRDEVRRLSRNTAYVFALINYYTAQDF